MERMEQQMEVEIPYRYNPRAYQIPLLREVQKGKFKRFVWIAHRRSGKDKTVLNAVISKMLDRVGVYYYFFPTFNQGRKILWQGKDKDGFPFLGHFPKALIKGEPNNTEMRIELKNGSVFQVVGADNIDNIVGTNPVGVVFSEYSLMKSKVWEFIRPILAENDGFAIFVYTPRGMNEGWKILQTAKENPAEWWYEVLTVDDTHAISPEKLEQERKEMPSDLFEQEYYVKFIDGASNVFRKVDEAIRQTEEGIGLKPGRRYQIGVDLAKHHDFTVVTAIDLHTFDVVKQMEFNNLDWNEQKEIIVKEVKYWNKGRTIVDSTGVGDPITDDLKRQGLFVEPFHFTETSREQLLNNLKILLEQGRIKIPNDQKLIDQLKSMQYELEGRKVKMRVPENLHDDRIMSLALACWGLYERLPLRDIEILESKRRKQRDQHGIRVKMTSY